MYKVMIVDDELYVVALIERLIDWKALDMEVAGKAYDGMEALKMVGELSPDIVIVDVCMPEYDGITLMQEIRKINTNIKFIVISGHKKFEYARSAIQYNIEDYLLKPIDQEEFYAILKKLKEKLDTETSSEKELKILDRQLAETKKQLRLYFMDMFAEKKLDFEEWNVDRIEASCYIHLRKDIFRIIQFKLDVREREVDTTFLDGIMEKVRRNIEEYMRSPDYEMAAAEKNTRIITLLNYNGGQWQPVLRQLKRLHLAVEEMTEKFEKVKITIVTGNEYHDLGDSYRELELTDRAMGARISLGCGRIYSVKDVKETPEALAQILTEVRNARLEEGLKEWEEQTFRKILMELFGAADQWRGRDSLIYMRIAAAVFQTFDRYVRQEELSAIPSAGLWEKFAERMSVCMEPVDVRRELHAFIAGHMKTVLEALSTDESPAIRLARKYIAQNYQDNITLAQAAEKVNLSRVYFSILFKRETGVNFSEYLNQYRIDAAKELLKDIHYNISEVAGLTGFQDSRYFSKVFKKAVGISPSDYRGRHMN